MLLLILIPPAVQVHAFSFNGLLQDPIMSQQHPIRISTAIIVHPASHRIRRHVQRQARKCNVLPERLPAAAPLSDPPCCREQTI